MVHGMFEIEMTPNGPDLEVCGPIFWQGDPGNPPEPATAIEVVAVVVIQPLPDLLFAYATPRRRFVNHEDEWEATVTLDGGAILGHRVRDGPRRHSGHTRRPGRAALQLRALERDDPPHGLNDAPAATASPAA